MPTHHPPGLKAGHILMKSGGTVTHPDPQLLIGILVSGP